MPAGTSNPSGVFVAVVFYLLVVVMPLAVATLHVLTFLLPSQPELRARVHTASVLLSPWACIDMYVITAILSVHEYSGLMGAVSTNAFQGMLREVLPEAVLDDVLANTPQLLLAEAECLWGTWLAVAATILLWIDMMLAARWSATRSQQVVVASREGGKVSSQSSV